MTNETTTRPPNLGDIDRAVFAMAAGRTQHSATWPDFAVARLLVEADPAVAEAKRVMTCAKFAAAYHAARASGFLVVRIGTHTTSPRSLAAWVRDADSPSGKMKLPAPSIEDTPANVATLRELGVKL